MKNVRRILVALSCIVGLAAYAFADTESIGLSNITGETTMQKTIITSPQKTLVGITVRTNNKNEADWQNGTAKIFPCVKRYFHEQLASQISHRVNPGTTLCAYTEYESDHTGDYTYFIGEEVSSVDVAALPEGFKVIAVPAQHYAKFTTAPGNMPEVLRDAWFAIWKMSEADFGGKRSYGVDYEVYDERSAAADHKGLVIDILIGIEKA
ncbi:MAG: GyrI-like domain-containing protein [bacterium]